MGNSIYDMVQLTGDCPTENPNGKMPLLDTEVWVEGNVVQYNDYRKPCRAVPSIGDVRDVSNAGGHEEDGVDTVGGEDQEKHQARDTMDNH